MRTSVKFAIGGFAVAALATLLGCSSELAAGVSGAGASAAKHGAQMAAEGVANGNPIESMVGSIFQALGILTGSVATIYAVATRASGKVADKKIAAYDAAPDTHTFTPDGTVIKS